MPADDFELAFDLANDTDWRSYVAERARLKIGVDLPPDRLAASFLVATIDEVIVGRTSSRHQLNEWLLAFGGHIGLLPPFRRRGCATEILGAVLDRRAGLRCRSRPPHL